MCIHQNEIREAVWSRWKGCRGLGGSVWGRWEGFRVMGGSVEVGGVQRAGRQCGGGGRGAGGWETSEGGCEGCRGLVSCIPAWDGWGMSEDPTQQGACGVRRVATCYLLGAWGLVSGACAAGSSWDRNPGRCGIALGILGSWGLLRSAAQRIKEPHSAYIDLVLEWRSELNRPCTQNGATRLPMARNTYNIVLRLTRQLKTKTSFGRTDARTTII